MEQLWDVGRNRYILDLTRHKFIRFRRSAICRELIRRASDRLVCRRDELRWLNIENGWRRCRIRDCRGAFCQRVFPRLMQIRWVFFPGEGVGQEGGLSAHSCGCTNTRKLSASRSLTPTRGPELRLQTRSIYRLGLLSTPRSAESTVTIYLSVGWLVSSPVAVWANAFVESWGRHALWGCIRHGAVRWVVWTRAMVVTAKWHYSVPDNIK